MTRKAGISLLDLFTVADQVNSVLPQQVRDFFGCFALIDYSSRRAPGAIIHHGHIQALSDSLGTDDVELDVGIGRLSLPLIHTGLPFQLSMQRQATVDTLEPAAGAWQFDLFLADFTLTVDGLQPALFIEENGTVPRHLLRDPNKDTVSIIGSAVLRLQKNAGSSDISFLFVDKPDPFDPTLDSGAVALLDFNPPHFFLGSSEIGLSVRKLLFDFSRSYSPPSVLERNQGPEWMGLAIREATVYAPRNLPVIGDLSGGVKDLLIGRPAGVQGEFELQFGRTPLDPATFQFKQLPDGDSRPVDMSDTFPRVIFEGSQDPDKQVEFRAGFTAPAPPDDGNLPEGALQDWIAIWTWPGKDPVEGDSSGGNVGHNSILEVQPVEIITVEGEPQRFKHPPFTVRFLAAGRPPTINLWAGSKTLENVVHLNGKTEAIDLARLEAASHASGNSQFKWSIEINNETVEETVTNGVSFKPQLAGWTDSQDADPEEDQEDDKIFVVLREKVDGEDGHRVARLQICITDQEPLLIGCEEGVFAADASDPEIDVNRPELIAHPPPGEGNYHGYQRYVLSIFHKKGEFEGGATAYHLLRPNQLAKVPIRKSQHTPKTEEKSADAPKPTDRHVQIQMKFAENKALRWGDQKPKEVFTAANEENIHKQLLRWAAKFPDAEFLLIGRTDDLNFGESDKAADPTDGNIKLAKARAQKGYEMLTTASGNQSAIDVSRIVHVGEHREFDEDDNAGTRLDDLEENLDETKRTQAEWLIRKEMDMTHWEMKHDVGFPYEPDRQRYRRVDIYAVDDTPPQPEPELPEPESPGATRYSLIPAPDRDPTVVPPSGPAIDYRVRLRFVWDSPTVTRWADAVPTLAEAEFVWTPKELPLPEIDGEEIQASRETLTIHAQWTHDVRTGFTRTNLGIRSDGSQDGLITTEQKNLTAALALSPMLLSGVNSETDTIETGARMAALIAIAAFAGEGLDSGKPLVGDGSKATLIAVEAEAQTRAISDMAEDYQVRLTGDYVCTLHIDGGALGLKTAANRPMKIRYKNVGFEFDNSRSGWGKVGLAFDTSSMEIEDPGQWQIDGVLGSLLRIVEISMGRGSLWIEGRFAIAINIGVVEISEAIIRLTFEDENPLPKFELRGFVLKADIPGVLEGEGRLRIENEGVIRAGVDATILPLKLSASAALALRREADREPYTYLTLAIGVQFSTPLPLLSTGAALYGMKGMIVMNGERQLPSGKNDDPIGQELAWWGREPENKYGPHQGQYALGVGVVVGTLPDASFCFSASGMLVVGFPDPEVILGVDVKILEIPDTTVKDKGAPEGTITGLIVIDSDAVKVGVSAHYEIPKVLKLDVPFGAYFPYDGNGAFVRLGCDGQTDFGRHGEPITLTLLPKTLDAKAWAYLMIEQGGLPSLGGDSRFSFDGFSVGFGAGWSIDWSAGPIKLSASAKVLVGFGTNPLLIKGGVFVAGELDLVVLSISARGELILTYLNAPGQSAKLQLKGEFCGEVDMFFFSLKGCVGVSIGDDIDTLMSPEPEPPLASVSLTDRRDRIMGEATQNPAAIAAKPLFDLDDDGNNKGAPPKDNHTVWPDTAPVLHFSHYIANALGEDAQFSPGSPAGQPVWFGSNRLKYAYRLDSLKLSRNRDGVLVGEGETLLSAWVSGAYRQPVSEPGNPEPGEHEGPSLKLLDWNPWNWVLNMPDGGEGATGDPVREVENLCETIAQPRQACVFGRAAKGLGWHAVELRQQTRAEPPYPSRFHVIGEPMLRSGEMRLRQRELQLLMSLLGAHVVPGRLVDLPFLVDVAGTTLARGYRLPNARRATDGGQLGTALPWQARFDRQLARPRITLLACELPARPRPTRKQCIDFGSLRATGKDLHLNLDGIDIHAIESDQPFALTDVVDAPGLRAGQDNQTDIWFGSAGIELRLAVPCRQIELGLMKLDEAEIQITAFDKNGREVVRDRVEGPTARPLKQHINAADDIARVRITGGGKGGGKGGALFEFCCIVASDTKDDLDCEDFSRLKLPLRPVPRIEYRGFVFEALKPGKQSLLFEHRIRSAGIGFPASGMRIDLANSSGTVELLIMPVNAEPVTAVAFDGNDNPVTKDVTSRSQQRLLLEAVGEKTIHTVQISGGAGKAVLSRICCRAVTPEFDTGIANPILSKIAAEQPGSPVAAFIAGKDTREQDTPLVHGIVNDQPADTWPGRVLYEQPHEGRHCQIIEYQPANDKESAWRGFEIQSWPGWQITVLAVCGIDQIMIERRAADAAHREQRRNDVADQTDGELGRALLLEPGEEYKLELEWSWQAWQANEDGTDSPPTTPPNEEWKHASKSQSFHFAVASEQPPGDSPQDGLNEYQFDVRDISRHLQRVEPADGRACHFTDDPLWVHFDAGHVQQLAQRYDRDLMLEVRRTDPPPQPSADALTQRLTQLTVLDSGWSHGPQTLAHAGIRRINEAVHAAACLPNGLSMGGSSLHARFALEPRAMYDLRLIAPQVDGNGNASDPRSISATRFVTSRYANPAELLADLGYYQDSSAPYPPDDIILAADALLPVGPEEVSDSLLDELLQAMDADTLPLPSHQPASYVIWRMDDSHEPQWLIEGLLIDSLESLLRKTFVQHGDRSEIVTRCNVRKATIGDHKLSLFRCNKNHTRLFLKADHPFRLTNGDHQLELKMETDAGELRGRRRLSHQPAIIEREGF